MSGNIDASAGNGDAFSAYDRRYLVERLPDGLARVRDHQSGGSAVYDPRTGRCRSTVSIAPADVVDEIVERWGRRFTADDLHAYTARSADGDAPGGLADGDAQQAGGDENDRRGSTQGLVQRRYQLAPATQSDGKPPFPHAITVGTRVVAWTPQRAASAWGADATASHAEVSYQTTYN